VKSKLFNALERIYETFVILMALVMVVLLFEESLSIVLQLKDVALTLERSRFNELIVDVLTFFVLIELIRMFTSYIEHRRVKLSIMAELGAVFVLRELFLILYTRHYSWETLIAFSILLISVGVVRTLAVVYSPTEES